MKITHLAPISLILLLIASCAPFWYLDYQIPRGELYKPSSVPKLIKALDDKNENVRILATQTLEYIGPEAKEAIPALIKASENNNVASYALPALVKIGKEDKTIVPHVIKLLEKDDLRYVAAESLEKMGQTAKEAIPFLQKIVLTKQDYDQYSAAKAIDAIGMDAKEIIINDRYKIEIKVKPIIRVSLYIRSQDLEFQFPYWGFMPVYFSFKNKTDHEISIDPKNIRVLDSKNNTLLFSEMKDVIDAYQGREAGKVLFTAVLMLPVGISQGVWLKQYADALDEYSNKNTLQNKKLKMDETIEGVVIYRLNEGHEKDTLENYRVIIPFKNNNNKDIFSLTTGLYSDDNINSEHIKGPTLENKTAIHQKDIEEKINKLRGLLNKGLISQEEFNAIVNNMLEGKDQSKPK